jgi:aryl-alcohol dehydrogenase-like predicted oxidoreductase
MRYKLLGRTGLRVSELCLGAMIFGDTRGSWGVSEEEAGSILETFAEAGGNFVDTANAYAGGQSERILGGVISPDRERWVISTKYTLNTRPGDPNGGEATARASSVPWMKACVGSGPTTWTCTGCTSGTPSRPSRRSFVPWTTR